MQIPQTTETKPALDENASQTVLPKRTIHYRKKLPHVGGRCVKTAVSATLCALIYSFFGRNPTFACIGAVFGMDNSLPSSLRTGGNRLAGTVIGGLIGMGLFSLCRISPYRDVTRMILLFAGIILLIYTSQLLHFTGAIQAGAVVFYIVMLNTPEDQYITYAFNRILDTGVGVIMSILINWVDMGKLHRKKKIT